MNILTKFLLAGAMTLGIVVPATLPAGASTYQDRSNHNIWHVRRHLEFDIHQLQRDQRDYHGYRERAIAEIQSARNELLAAEEFARGRQDGGFSTAAMDTSVERDQWRSNRNMWFVRKDIERQIEKLSRDDSDYGGHKGAAVRDLKAARHDLLGGERFAHEFGY